MIANVETSKSGRYRAICAHCDKRSRWIDPNAWGPNNYPPRWANAPYPDSFVHPDGSTGALWTCPACLRLAAERQRAGITPLLTATAQRRTACASRRRASTQGNQQLTAQIHNRDGESQ